MDRGRRPTKISTEVELAMSGGKKSKITESERRSLPKYIPQNRKCPYWKRPGGPKTVRFTDKMVKHHRFTGRALNLTQMTWLTNQNQCTDPVVTGQNQPTPI